MTKEFSIFWLRYDVQVSCSVVVNRFDLNGADGFACVLVHVYCVPNENIIYNEKYIVE